MYQGELFVALVLGISLSIIFADILGIIPAGIIVPSFLALVFDQPVALIAILLIAIISYMSVEWLSKHIILYGRRKFGAMILASLLIKAGLMFVMKMYHLDFLVLNGMGIIIPGLIANSFGKQGIVPTVASMFALGGITYLGLLIYIFLV
ncbi:MAG: poly-gamma-glutamate biosynthesis protein PgsC [Firmicutes bacterium]|nr:poly-gamma-glutamate biosynthesis protein PgsC [Bacillota bacterium]